SFSQFYSYKPGALFLEIANKCEAEIIKNGCGLSFPR
ncbi:unnamed protein product, partial [marine sediment metagenome]